MLRRVGLKLYPITTVNTEDLLLSHIIHDSYKYIVILYLTRVSGMRTKYKIIYMYM